MPSIRAVLAAAAGAATLFTSLAGAAPNKSPVDLNKRTTKFAYGSEKVRGVNLGGWLVLEPWITPSIFSSEQFVDEYTMGQVLAPQAGLSVLTKHWETWITEADFAKIASLGLNHVRIPIGYWSIVPIPGNPHIVGAYQYLGKAITWAQNHGLKVMIDLHGAPGSQNGFDNSGRRGAVRWTQNQSLQRTHAALNKIRDDHASNPAVSTIELVNEPLGPQLDRNVLEGFYYDAYGDLANSDVAVTFQDAFYGVNSWNNFGHYLPNWIQDTHHYEVFTAQDLTLDGPGHVRSACAFGVNMTANNKPTISGEFTGAMTDCTKWLNGVGEGARYDGSYNYEGQTSYFIGGCDGLRGGTVASLDPTYRENVGKFVEAQMDAFESAAGWIFWTWKTEQSPDWDFQALSDAGVIPNPVTKRNHPGQCS